MKKFFAALLAIFITAAFTGCNKPDDEQLITEDNSSVTEASADISDTKPAVSSDDETEDTPLKETSETKTETVTEKAVDTENRGKTFSADAESLIGEWYAIDFIGMKNAAVTFKEDGSISLASGDETEVGTYTVSDGLVEVVYNDGKDWGAWAALFDGDVLIMKFIGLNQEVIREDYRPYSSELSAGEYLDSVGSYGAELVLSREKSKLAEQEDVLGAWYASKDDVEGVMLFKENSITDMSLGDISSYPLVLRNGVYTETGEMPLNVSMAECSFYLCGGKIYMISNDDDYFEYDEHTLVLERFETAPLTADMLDGSVGRDNEIYYYFKDGQFYVFAEIADKVGYDFKIDGDKIILPIDGDDVTFSYYIVGDDIYLAGENMNIALTLTE